MSAPEPQAEAPADLAPSMVTISAEEYTQLRASVDQHLLGSNRRLMVIAEMINQIRVGQTRPADLASLERQMTAMLVALEMINAELIAPLERIRAVEKRAAANPPGEAHG